MPIIRRSNCVYATLGICHSVWMTVWYAGWNENEIKNKSRICRFPNGRHRASYLLADDKTRCVHAHYKATIPHEVLSVSVVTHYELGSWICTSLFAVPVRGFLVKMLQRLKLLSVEFRTQSALPSF